MRQFLLLLLFFRLSYALPFTFITAVFSYTSSGFAPANDILNNPYCGWYDMFGYTISDASADTFDKRTQDYIQKSGSTRLVLLEINLKNFNNTELSDNALAQIDRIFTMWVKARMLLFCVFYTTGMERRCRQNQTALKPSNFT